MADKKRCLVVMGFGIKTDLATGRKLNLDNAYRNMIKPAVEQTGLECVRADEIPHSGSIEVQMYLELLTADVVVADISTANPNAIYRAGHPARAAAPDHGGDLRVGARLPVRPQSHPDHVLHPSRRRRRGR